jgi:hypothetical protein
MSYQMIWILPDPNLRVSDYTGRPHKSQANLPKLNSNNTLSILYYNQVLFLGTQHRTSAVARAFVLAYRIMRHATYHRREWK